MEKKGPPLNPISVSYSSIDDPTTSEIFLWAKDRFRWKPKKHLRPPFLVFWALLYFSLLSHSRERDSHGWIEMRFKLLHEHLLSSRLHAWLYSPSEEKKETLSSHCPVMSKSIVGQEKNREDILLLQTISVYEISVSVISSIGSRSSGYIPGIFGPRDETRTRNSKHFSFGQRACDDGKLSNLFSLPARRTQQ